MSMNTILSTPDILVHVSNLHNHLETLNDAWTQVWQEHNAIAEPTVWQGLSQEASTTSFEDMDRLFTNFYQTQHALLSTIKTTHAAHQDVDAQGARGLTVS